MLSEQHAERSVPEVPVAPPDPSYPRLPQALALLLLVLVLQLGAAVAGYAIVSAAGALLHRQIHADTFLLSLASLISFWFALRLGVRRTGRPLADIVPLQGVPLTLVVPMAATLFGAHIVASELENVVERVAPSPAWLHDLLGGGSSAGEAWGALLLAGVIAPITEEPLFRGLLLRGFVQHYSQLKALTLSALLFGAMHLNPWQFVTAAVLGTLFGWWVLRTGSILPAVAGHAVSNLLPVLTVGVLRFDERIPGYANRIGQPIQWQPAWFDALGLLLIVGGVLVTRHLLEQARKVGSVSGSSRSDL